MCSREMVEVAGKRQNSGYGGEPGSAVLRGAWWVKAKTLVQN